MTNWKKSDMPDLKGKVAIVTGANSGIGYETARALAGKGATVVLACRSLERGGQAAATIREIFPPADLNVIELDLASLNSVRKFAETFHGKYDRLDLLINNGGPIVGPKSVTADGFETHFGVNHIGHFALTGLLLDVLLRTPSSRVVSVTSRMHAEGKINWDDLNSQESYNRMESYRQSKLANILFAFELSRRLEAAEADVTSVAVHPGLVNTNWANNNFNGLMRFLMNQLSRFTYQSPEMGALPLLYAAASPDVKTGGYYGPEADTKGYPVEVRAGEVAYDEDSARRLWDVSEELSGVKFKAINP